jgi:maltose O-acetyltransferase
MVGFSIKIESTAPPLLDGERGESVSGKMTEKEKLLGGKRYDPLDPQLSAERRRARLRYKALNDTRGDQQEERARLIRALIHASGQDIWIEPPFYCDDGSHLTLGDKVFFNCNRVVLDVAPVRIGSGVLIGPAAQISAATHPLRAVERRTGLEYGRPGEIGARYGSAVARSSAPASGSGRGW